MRRVPGPAAERDAPARRRRGVLLLAAGALLAARPTWPRECDVCPAAPSEEFEFDQPPSASPAAFMGIALRARDFATARGDPAYGAAVVVGDLVVGAAPNRTLTRRDPTAHAEIEAIRDGCRQLGAARLAGGVIYASARPCRMCELACYYAGIERIVFGEGLVDAGAPRYEAC
jgi:tRNA(Arg) A34 adenosine deaminase TadA